MGSNDLTQRFRKEGGVHRLEEFWWIADELFLETAFEAILGRPPDLPSLEFFARSLATGHFSRIEVLGHLQNSPEGRRRGVRIRGLRPRFMLVRVARRLPLLGALIQFLVELSLLPTEIHSLRVGILNISSSCRTREGCVKGFSDHGGWDQSQVREPQWAGDTRALGSNRDSSVRPFDFAGLSRLSNRRLVPDWFRSYWEPAEQSREYWEEQYRSALGGADYELPKDTMRHPSNELHQSMALNFWQEVPKDFSSILDVGCSDGFMVKVFQDAGKEAVGINDFLYPTDRLYIQENSLEVREMDMHALEFEEESFDAVWCRHTLEHSFSPLRVLSEIYRVLRHDGYAFIVLPPPPVPPEPYPGHWHQIPEYQLGYLLMLTNFSILDMRTAWFSFREARDNLEIRAICRKRESSG